MTRRARLAVAGVVALVLVTGASARSDAGGGGRIVFASSLPVYPPPPNLNATRLGSVRVDGQGRVALNGTEGTPFTIWEVSPDGARIAFAQSESPRSLWVMAADGGSRRKLLTVGEREELSGELRWSPGGRRLAVGVVSYAGCGGGGTKCADWFLTIFNAVSGRQLEGIGQAQNIEWSPDGKTYAFETGLFALMPEAVDVRVGPGGYSIAPKGGPWCVGGWSRDSRWLFLFADEAQDGLCDGRAVAVRTRDGKLLAIDDRQPSMSLDGRRIAMQYGKSLRILDGNGRLLRRVAGVFHGWLGSDTTMVAVNGDRIRVLDRDGRLLRWFPGSSPSVARSGSRIAALRDSTVTIYDPRGRHLRNLAVSKGLTALGSWSPDGKRLEVRRGSSVGVLSLATSALTWLLEEPPGSHVATWWTPDSSRLVYASTLTAEPERFRTLWTMDGSGGDVQRVTGTSAFYDEPSWSADGAWIIATRKPRGWYDRAVESKPTIVKLRPDGTGERAIVPNGEAPFWSPDGRAIAFTRIEPDGEAAVYVATAEGRSLKRIVSGRGFSWSPDGTTIAFYATGGGVYGVTPKGTNRRRLLSSNAYGATWSPDGGRLAFTDCCVSSGSALVVSGADGSNARVVTEMRAASATSRSITWSPDGTLLAFGARAFDSTVDSGVTDGVYVVPATGGTPKNLTPWPVLSGAPNWSR